MDFRSYGSARLNCNVSCQTKKPAFSPEDESCPRYHFVLSLPHRRDLCQCEITLSRCNRRTCRGLLQMPEAVFPRNGNGRGPLQVGALLQSHLPLIFPHPSQPPGILCSVPMKVLSFSLRLSGFRVTQVFRDCQGKFHLLPFQRKMPYDRSKRYDSRKPKHLLFAGVKIIPKHQGGAL